MFFSLTVWANGVNLFKIALLRRAVAVDLGQTFFRPNIWLSLNSIKMLLVLQVIFAANILCQNFF
jgi:hypothetical protein